MKRSATHHVLRALTAVGVAACVTFALGLALVNGPVAVVGLIGVVLVASAIPFIVIHFDEQVRTGGHGRP